ncbi:MAG TPA: RNA-binding S4 domain-containing protein [Bacteroidetes bacterium]|nr:RNA-binding S4 domain-containing protein [Bacteroidota bacterium]
MREETGTGQRIDKFLWSVRIYKTRSMATEACKKGRVIINDIPVKPSRQVTAGEIIKVKKTPVLYGYKIREIPSSRVSAKVVDAYLEDQTPEEEKIKLDMKQKTQVLYRYKGTGRPTKKERRDLDRLMDK